MDILFFVLFIGAMIGFGYVFMLNSTLSKGNETLICLNDRLENENTELKTKNASMWARVKELSSISDEAKKELENLLEKQDIHIIPVGAKVKWIDKTKEEETGMVLDDFISGEKHYVVIRRIKKNKLVGGPISLSADKVTVVE